MNSFDKVLAQASNSKWRSLLILSRLGGLRIPSEVASLKWSDIDWSAKRLTVKSPKTEHHRGGDSRVVPLLKRIEDELRLHWGTSDGKHDSKVFPDVHPGTNLRSQLERFIRASGVIQWPKLWQNLRASAATDFARNHPSHVATAICGHTEEVARENYWKVTEADLDGVLAKDSSCSEAKQKAKQQTAVSTRIGPQGDLQWTDFAEIKLVLSDFEKNKWAIQDSNL